MGQNLAGSSKSLPLCVDLDGTLISGDLLVEAFVRLITSKPLCLFLVPFWLLQGKSVLKDELARRVSIDVTVLPYRTEVIDYLKEQKNAGRELVLASASHHSQVQSVADHIGIFSDVFASTRDSNLKGSVKARVLSERFGENAFCYVGDSAADVEVWRKAGSAIVVSSDKGLVAKAKKVSSLENHFSVKASVRIKSVIKALRPHQWVKNLLLFVPAIMGQKINDPLVLMAVIKAFIAFSFCASAVYVLNDLTDLNSDRVHKKKSKRPFASGDLSLIAGLALFPVLLLVAGLIATSLPPAFHGILVIYLITTTLYSFYLKQKAIIDILTLASLYTLRIFAGGCATGIVVSPWLLAFSIFMFLSLASVKRYSELWLLKEAKKDSTPGRGYRSSDLELIGQSGIASGYLAVLVMALYINSPEMVKFYSHGHFLWGMCLPMLYWISRVWLLAFRGEMNEDPILFALKDPPSYIVGGLCIGLLVVSM